MRQGAGAGTSSKGRKASGAGGASTATAAELRIILGYGMIVVLTLISSLPISVVSVVYVYLDGCPGTWRYVCSTANLLLTVNAAGNPMIYCATQTVYRQAFLRVLRCQGPAATGSRSPPLLEDHSFPRARRKHWLPCSCASASV